MATLQFKLGSALGQPRVARVTKPAALRCFASVRSGSACIQRPAFSSSVSGLSVPSVRPSVHRVARKSVVVANSASAAAPPAPFKWGCNIKDLTLCVGTGLLLWFVPHPAGVTDKAWHLLAVFVATIVGIIKSPFPGGLGSVAILGLGAAMVTKVLTFPEAFSAFGSEIPCVLLCSNTQASCHSRRLRAGG
jgi:hypothetical protein